MSISCTYMILRKLYTQYSQLVCFEHMHIESERPDTRGEELMWLCERYKKNIKIVDEKQSNSMLRRDMKDTFFFRATDDIDTIFKEFEMLNHI